MAAAQGRQGRGIVPVSAIEKGVFMRVLITGGSGVVGWALARHAISLGRETHITYLSHAVQMQGAEAHQLDITNETEVEQLIAKIKPDAIYHCAALTNVDKCETDHALADLHNSKATGFVARAAAKLKGAAGARQAGREDGEAGAGALLVYISTSYVFGASLAPLPEDAPYCPTTYYGQSKADGEKEVKAAGDSHLILRIDQPYGWVESFQKQNTVARVVKELGAGRAVREPKDWLNSPTYLNNFVQLAEALRGKGRRGTYNCVGADFLSRYEWALKIAGAFGLDKKLITQFDSSELKLPAKRPNVRLDISKAQADGGLKIFGIDEGLADMIKTRPKK